MFKLALSDIDNTLVPYGLSSTTPKTIDAIREFMASGGIFGPISGRDWDEVTALFPGSEDVLGCGVLVNGSRIYLDGKPVVERTLDRGEISRVVGLVSSHSGFSLTVRTRERAFLFGWDRDFLLDVRNRKFGYSTLSELMLNLKDKMDEAIKNSTIKEEIDRKMVNEILLNARKQFNQ